MANLEVVATQVLEGGHTILYLRNTDSSEPLLVGAKTGLELRAMIEAADPETDTDPAALASSITALHAHRAKVVRDIAEKEKHHEALAAATATSSKSAKR